MQELKFIMLTEDGIEESAKKEIKEFLGVNVETNSCYALFNLETKEKNIENLFKLIVLNQSARKILSVINSFDFKDEEDLFLKLEKSLENDVFNYWIKDNKTFVVRCIHDFSELSAMSIEPEVGSFILKKNPELKVSMENADIQFILYINKNTAFFCVDLNKNDLSKRQYKLINSGKSINAGLAYHLIREIDYKEGEILLDPNSKTAEIVIEASLFISGMHNFYESNYYAQKVKLFKDINSNKIIDNIKNNARNKLKKLKKKKIFAYSDLLKDVTSGKSNAKVAGILDLIEFSKVGIDWLDTKFDKESVDKIITFLPSESKTIKQKDVSKIYKEFVYQAEYVIKKDAKIGILIQKPETFIKFAKEKAFNLEKESKIRIGELVLYYIILTK
jgi:23S rRNA G2445 N2-methylase RlmL